MIAQPVSSAILSARRDAGAGLRLVTLTPPLDVAQAYRAPGQYIEVRSPNGSGYFALAGEVGAPTWEVLVRSNGDASDALTEAPEGTVFELAGPLGRGFPLERGHDRALVVAVAGSALAVARPVMGDRCALGLAPATTVYIGAKTARDVPLASEVASWARAGARVVLCLSRPDVDDAAILPEASRKPGWVQRVIAEEIASLGRSEREPVLAFAAGPFGMLDELRALAASHAHATDSAPPFEIVTNV